MDKAKLDYVRESVLAQMERSNRHRQYAIIAAALCEGLFGLMAIQMIEWSDRLQVVIFLLFMLTYTVTAMGLIALGVHITQNASRVIAAIQSIADQDR